MQNIKCNACNKDKLQTLINIGKHPISTHLIKTENDQYKFYDHKYGYCIKCDLVQQTKLVSINKLVPDTVWHLNKEENTHHSDFISKIVNKKIINKENKILFTSHYDNFYFEELKKKQFSSFFFLSKLSYFKNLKNAERQDIIQKSLNPFNAKKVVDDYGNFDVIFCSSILDHSSSIKNFFNFFNKILKNNGILIVEVPDNTKSIKQGNAIFFWEEHRFYFTINSLLNIAKFNKFYKKKLIQYKYPQEDFINAIFCKKNNNLDEIKKKQVNPLVKFNNKFLQFKKKSNKIIDYYKKNNYKIYLFGAGHNSIKFIFFYNLNKIIDNVIDDNPKKFNYLVPSTNINITNSDILKESKTNKILIINGASIKNETKIFQSLKNKFTGKIIKFKSIYTASNKFIFKND